jgi:hypothetical protein
MRKTAAVALAVLLATGAAARAAPIIQFAQTANVNTITATANAGDTATTIAASNVAVNITQDLGGFLGAAFFNINATSTDPAVAVGTGVLQHYSGTFSLVSGLGGSGSNYLSGVFTDAALGTGGALTIGIGSPPDLLTLTSSFLTAAQLGQPSAAAFSLTNAGDITLNNHTIDSFTATVSGNVSASPTAVIEPGTLALLGAGLFGMCAVRYRRRQA